MHCTDEDFKPHIWGSGGARMRFGSSSPVFFFPALRRRHGLRCRRRRRGCRLVRHERGVVACCHGRRRARLPCPQPVGLKASKGVKLPGKERGDSMQTKPDNQTHRFLARLSLALHQLKLATVTGQCIYLVEQYTYLLPFVQQFFYQIVYVFLLKSR